MLKTPSTTAWEISLEIFSFLFRPCRQPQETIWDYHLDGRPQFEWERLRTMYMLEGNPKIWSYCENCPLNIFGEVEGCRGTVENLDIFFRALNELTPENPWSRVSTEGKPIPPGEMEEMRIYLQTLREALSKQTWPVAIPRLSGKPYYEDPEAGGGRYQYYAWNGEGPPSVLHYNEGYTVYMSRHGLLVKPSGEDPVPHAFSRLYRDGRGVYGLSRQGETVGFQMAFARYPQWGFELAPGAELSLENMAADQVFVDILDILEVFCAVACEYEIGLLFQASS